jgi:hypothetical protein
MIHKKLRGVAVIFTVPTFIHPGAMIHELSPYKKI